jgi:hypothetical protein
MGAVLLPMIGAALGIVGYFSALPWLLIVGAALCGLNELLNVASGVDKFPFVLVVLVVLAGAVIAPWYVGAMLGLCAAGAVEGLSEGYGRMTERRS